MNFNVAQKGLTMQTMLLTHEVTSMLQRGQKGGFLSEASLQRRDYVALLRDPLAPAGFLANFNKN